MIKNKKLRKLKSELNNITEEIVLEMLEKLLKREEFDNICKDQECLLDMATYALNRLPAKYVATFRGEAFSKADELEQQHSVDVLAIVTQAIKVVAANEHHAEHKSEHQNQEQS
ncbi:late competence development ComFB family protein [Halanaerobium praevalens]|uniref:Late competence development protein ComFB n=1 Tax=Halanaerobium praevalens (strain ATCC 33744 / DSM 2228 / GSL) TaxID=572479 RepID=E3DQL1_HALPG|nr:late competence development ComFB family protein [Halanaerobium praevalens]ADO77922.1 Late competence development protein ComFB [Halanaerobium praevalens DSM 2228]